MSLTVVIPTIAGREALCERAVASIRATTEDAQVIVVRERPTIGRAWNDGMDAADGEYVMLGADDIIAHPGWADAAIEAVEAGCYPAPRISKVDGSTLATGSMGGGWLLTGCADWAPVVSSQFPFLRRYWWREMGPCLDVHYFADDYLAARARAAGISVVHRDGYHLTHMEGTHGRDEMVNRSMTDRLTFEQAMAEPVWDRVAV